jgi:hypothetical protein
MEKSIDTTPMVLEVRSKSELAMLLIYSIFFNH